MPSRNEPCPCGSKQKYKKCCLGASRRSGSPGGPPPRRPPPSGVDAATAEAAALVTDMAASPHLFQRVSDGMVLLQTMFQEDGPLACLRWSWDEFIPPVERHIFRVTEEVADMEERRDRLFDRCAPDLLSPERVERFDQEVRRVLMEPGRTREERFALAVAVLEMRGMPRHPPYTHRKHRTVAWLMNAQVSEWVERRGRLKDAVGRALGEDPRASGPQMSARALRRELEEPDAVMEAIREAVEADPLLLEIIGKYEQTLLVSILHGRTPEVLHGEEWLWMTVVLREPLRLERERAEAVEVEALLTRLDEEVKQAVLTRVEAASRDRSSPPEAQQWFEWAYKLIRASPLAFFGAFAKAVDAPLRERFEGEAELVRELQRRERWRAEELEPYRLHLAAWGAHAGEQRVRRLQALLRGEVAPAGRVFKV